MNDVRLKNRDLTWCILTKLARYVKDCVGEVDCSKVKQIYLF